jgi:hypothetical protein
VRHCRGEAQIGEDPDQRDGVQADAGLGQDRGGAIHDLRHTVGRSLAGPRVDVVTVQAWTGHAWVASQWVVGGETGTESRWCTLRSVHHPVARGAFSCILIMVVTFRGTHGAYGRNDSWAVALAASEDGLSSVLASTREGVGRSRAVRQGCAETVVRRASMPRGRASSATPNLGQCSADLWIASRSMLMDSSIRFRQLHPSLT